MTERIENDFQHGGGGDSIAFQEGVASTSSAPDKGEPPNN